MLFLSQATKRGMGQSSTWLHAMSPASIFPLPVTLFPKRSIRAGNMGTATCCFALCWCDATCKEDHRLLPGGMGIACPARRIRSLFILLFTNAVVPRMGRRSLNTAAPGQLRYDVPGEKHGSMHLLPAGSGGLQTTRSVMVLPFSPAGSSVFHEVSQVAGDSVTLL